LAQANRLVHQTNQIQLQNFASMSHEIRTPLNCIIGISSVLRESKLTLFQQESVDMIVRSGDLLLAVVNDVLDYSKLETDNVMVDIQKNNLQELLDFVLQSIASKAQGVQSIASCFDVMLPECIHMDSRRLQQILFNLLGNAVKFSPTDGTIEFSACLIIHPDDDPSTWRNSGECSSDKTISCPLRSIPVGSNFGEKSGMVGKKSHCPFHRNSPKVEKVTESPPIPRRVLRFVVKDNGKGIDQKDLKRIFQPFQQSSSATESVYGGTGLGLSITQKIVTALGGTISVESEKGSWSRFTVDLPCSDEPVNVHDISSQVKSWAVYLVGFAESERYKAMQIMGPFAMNISILSSMSEIPTAKEATTMVLLVHEDCFESSCMAGLISTQSTLFTFGPKFSVNESTTAHHFRSIDHMIPSFFVRTLVRHVTKQTMGSTMHTKSSMVDCMEVSSMDIGQEVEEKNEFSHLRVLLVEDNKVNQKVLSRMLHRLKVQRVDIVNNGLEACEKEAIERYDLILMDQQMPVMGGLEACRRIRRRSLLEGGNSPPIVFVTAHVLASVEAECVAAGGSGFVPKPFKLEEIEQCLRNVQHR
jgi:signal transduction histidine kinase/CheY-like chemotaxis protein